MPRGRRRRPIRYHSDTGCCIVAAIFLIPGLQPYSGYILPPLRTFRDEILMNFTMGRGFVDLYYRFSKFVLEDIAWLS